MRVTDIHTYIHTEPILEVLADLKIRALRAIISLKNKLTAALFLKQD